MIATVALFSSVIVGQVALPTRYGRADANAARLIVIVSTSGTRHENEFLILTPSDGAISWCFIDASGGKLREGRIEGSETNLIRAFENAVNRKIDSGQTRHVEESRISTYYSLVLIEVTNVRVCTLSNIRQQIELVQGDELRTVFDDVRKKVWGKLYHLPDLLMVGEGSGLRDETTPEAARKLLFPKSELPQ